MDKNNPYYQERKFLWELTQTKGWREHLKPLLERIVGDTYRKSIFELKDAFDVARQHAEIEYARNLLLTIERKAKEFTQI